MSDKQSMSTDSNNQSDRCQAYPRIWGDATGFAFAWYVDGHDAAKFLSNFPS